MSISETAAERKFKRVLKRAKNSTFRVFLGQQYDEHQDLVVEPVQGRRGCVAEGSTCQTMIAVAIEPPALVYNFLVHLQELEEREAILGFELAIDRHGLFD